MTKNKSNNGQRVKMESSENLLRDVITRQAGDKMKGIMELFQNAVDATRDLKKPEIRASLVLDDDGSAEFVFKDNGVGIGKTAEEIISRFAIFGDSGKAGDGSQIGEMGIGRGQAINMLVGSDRLTMKGELFIETQHGTGGFMMSDFCLKDMSFDIEEIPKSKTMPKGTSWEFHFKESPFDRSELSNYILKNIFLPSVDFELNGEEFVWMDGDGRDMTKVMTLAGDGWMFKQSKAMGTIKLYERGLYVDTFSLFGHVGGLLFVGVPLQLDMSRRNVLTEDKTWRRIVSELRLRLTLKTLKKKNVTRDECGALLSMINMIDRDSELFDALYNAQLLRDVRGHMYSLRDLASHGSVYYSDRGSIADKATGLGSIVVDNSYFESLPGRAQDAVSFYVNDMKNLEDSDLWKEIKNEEFKKLDATEEQKSILGILKDVMGDAKVGSRTLEDISFHVGEHKNYRAWTDSSNYIAFRKDMVKRAMAVQKAFGSFHACTYLMPLLSHELAHFQIGEDSMVTEGIHDVDFYELFERWVHTLNERIFDFFFENEERTQAMSVDLSKIIELMKEVEKEWSGFSVEYKKNQILLKGFYEFDDVRTNIKTLVWLDRRGLYAYFHRDLLEIRYCFEGVDANHKIASYVISKEEAKSKHLGSVGAVVRGKEEVLKIVPQIFEETILPEYVIY